MGFFSSIISSISAVTGGLTQENLDNKTYQKYANEIKKFDINPPSETLKSKATLPKEGRIAEEMPSAIDDIETLDDVKAYFAQREN